MRLIIHKSLPKALTVSFSMTFVMCCLNNSRTSVTEILDLSITRNSKNQKTAFRKLGMFPSSGKGRKTLTLLDPLETANLNYSKGPSRENVFLPPPEDRNRSSFKNIAFSSL
jgi:hypothetical protein